MFDFSNHGSRRPAFTWLETLVVVLLILFVGFIGFNVLLRTYFPRLFYDPRTISDMEGRHLPHFSMMSIGRAMEQYADDHDGRLPPAAIYSDAGVPLLSWRVLLLPYLEMGDLYRQFKLNEPWDSPHNLKLLATTPTSYFCLEGYRRRQPGTTYFQVFIGKGTPFEGREGCRLKDISRRSYTILVVEAATAVPWTKPEDIPYDADQPLPEFGGLFKEYFWVLFADGGSTTVRPGFDVVGFRRAILKNGNGSWPYERR